MIDARTVLLSRALFDDFVGQHFADTTTLGRFDYAVIGDITYATVTKSTAVAA